MVDRRTTHKEQPTRRTLLLRRDVVVEGDTRRGTEEVVIRDLDSNGMAISRTATRQQTCRTRPATMLQTTRVAISTPAVTGMRVDVSEAGILPLDALVVACREGPIRTLRTATPSKPRHHHRRSSRTCNGQ